VPTAIRQKGGKNINVSTSVQGGFANLAYSPTDHLYIVTQGSLSGQSYNFTSGLGSYYNLNENVSFEGNLQYGVGSFDWGDPFNGLSQPSQINYAAGDLNQTFALLAANFSTEKGNINSLAFTHRYLDVDFNSNTYDSFTGPPNNPKDYSFAKFHQFGLHYSFRAKIREHLRLFMGAGIEYSTASKFEYTYNPLFIRIGFELY
jgi:hypothetical protein